MSSPNIPTMSREIPPLSRAIRVYRHILGITQSQLAHEIGCTISFVCLLEGGFRELTEEWLTKIVAAFGASEYEFIAESGRFEKLRARSQK